MKLSEIRPGKSVRVVALGNDTRIAEKLKNLGITAGSVITVLRHAPFGATTEIKAGNTRIAIGVGETDKIAVEYV